MHLITLLLAFWAPLNAVSAGVTMLDCPMQATAESSADCPSHGGSHDEPVSSASGCDHCGNCVLLGGFSLPAQSTPAAIHLPSGAFDLALDDSVPAGIPDTPFRPPLSA